MHVCTYIYIYVCVCVCVYTYNHIYVYIYTHISSFTSIHIHIYMHVCMYVYIHMSRICIYAYMYICIYIYIYIHRWGVPPFHSTLEPELCHTVSNVLATWNEIVSKCVIHMLDGQYRNYFEAKLLFLLWRLKVIGSEQSTKPFGHVWFRQNQEFHGLCMGIFVDTSVKIFRTVLAACLIWGAGHWVQKCRNHWNLFVCLWVCLVAVWIQKC